MSTTVKGVSGPASRPPVRFVWGVAVPLAVASLSYALWWISDRLLWIGPLDRAAFGWIVVIPLWIAAPVVGGFAWRRLTLRMSVIAAIVVGAAISAAAALSMWQIVAFPACETGNIHTPDDWVVPSLWFGLLVGGGLALSGLIASNFARDSRPWLAILLGAGTEVAMIGAGILVGGAMFIGPHCQRPVPLPT
jgi:hypothetical protein